MLHPVKKLNFELTALYNITNTKKQHNELALYT